MQLTDNYSLNRGMEYIFKRLAENARTKKTEIIINRQTIREYVEELLTSAEQKLCDMATD